MSEDARYIVVLVTTSSNEESQKIADVLLNQRKAACINILPGVQSSYWWKGKIDTAEENLLIIKTKSALLAEVIALVKEVHSYEVPEIIAIPVIGGNDKYLEWIEAEVIV